MMDRWSWREIIPQKASRENLRQNLPYAAPPVGEWRWRPPQPPEPWQGVRDATAYANTCPQVTTLGVFAGPTSITEDCLYLNVFTTTVGHGKGHGGGNPVLVWIHGGGNVRSEEPRLNSSH